MNFKNFRGRYDRLTDSVLAASVALGVALLLFLLIGYRQESDPIEPFSGEPVRMLAADFFRKLSPVRRQVADPSLLIRSDSPYSYSAVKPNAVMQYAPRRFQTPLPVTVSRSHQNPVLLSALPPATVEFRNFVPEPLPQPKPSPKKITVCDLAGKELDSRGFPLPSDRRHPAGPTIIIRKNSRYSLPELFQSCGDDELDALALNWVAGEPIDGRRNTSHRGIVVHWPDFSTEREERK